MKNRNWVLQNFPFIEDDLNAITDYELFSRGFNYLNVEKVGKKELSEYAKKSDIPNTSNFVSKNEIAKVAYTGAYKDLNNKPYIPTKTSDLDNDSGFITKDVNNLTYYTLTSNLANVATSGSYTDLSNKPTIPTKTSDLNNDSGFITKSVDDLTNYTLTSSLATVATSGSYTDLSNKPTIPDVSNFITKDVNNLTYYTLTSNLANVATSGSYTDLSNKPTTYNSAETAIGTWIDGHTLYRKILTPTITSQTTYVQHGITNADVLVNVYGSFRRTNNLPIRNLLGGNYPNWESYVYDFNATTVTVKFSDNQYTNGISDLIIVLEYTKTS